MKNEGPKLLFTNPTFKEGINLTTRKGIKWAVVWDKFIPVAETGKEDIELGIAKIIETKVIPFASIPNEFLENEHDPSCRDWQGLFEEMKRVYPSFYEWEVVTLVYFEFKKHE